MPYIKVSELPEDTVVANTDLLMTVDQSVNPIANKKVTVANLANTVYQENLSRIDTQIRSTYEPGQIIEQISGVCDGRTVNVKSGTYTLANVTNFLDGTTTYQNVPGSVINYLPPAGTKVVNYKFEYHVEATSQSGISNHIVHLNGNEIYPSARTISSEYNGEAGQNYNHAHFQAVLQYSIVCDSDVTDYNYGKLTSWSTPLELKVMFREHDNNAYQIRLFRNTWWNGTGSFAPYSIVPPIITITAIA